MTSTWPRCSSVSEIYSHRSRLRLVLSLVLARARSRSLVNTVATASHGVRTADNLRRWCGIEDEDRLAVSSSRPTFPDP
jgi:hypothetical protein